MKLARLLLICLLALLVPLKGVASVSMLLPASATPADTQVAMSQEGGASDSSQMDIHPCHEVAEQDVDGDGTSATCGSCAPCHTVLALPRLTLPWSMAPITHQPVIGEYVPGPRVAFDAPLRPPR